MNPHSQIEGLTPKEIVEALDRYIVGQARAKRMVAIALRNRARRKKLPEALRDEVSPKNIIMIGPTGVGKTEIARRLSRLTGSPFLKVEATKYTEVGYVGRDVESMIRDLMEIGLTLVRNEKSEMVAAKAKAMAQERLLDLLLPAPPDFGRGKPEPPPSESEADMTPQQRYRRSRMKMRQRLEAGELEEREVELDLRGSGGGPGGLQGFVGIGGFEEMTMDLKDMMERMLPKQTKRRKMSVAEARRALVEEETDKLLDMDKIVEEARWRVEQMGIVFLDEFDKIAGRNAGHGPDVSREGVQRDILPIVEGSTVHTKYGLVKTDHILFIAAGAFHERKPSDLIPELQGRFPLRAELQALTADDFRRVLVEPDNALTKQYTALLATEGVALEFTSDGVDEIALSAQRINEQSENIGARRLHTILERILEEASYEAPDMAGARVIVDRPFVKDRLRDVLEDQDLGRFIL
ncbi:MAG: ATP-dependent protease ATPase subunit HslU [candidate division BRC1 bacterium ADurb.BinA364]|nr:MAG: ATP-dependent protease ATPase subunit HslU [candidate division BRC1 bacterium ADurb.BinA364]